MTLLSNCQTTGTGYFNDVKEDFGATMSPGGSHYHKAPLPHACHALTLRSQRAEFGGKPSQSLVSKSAYYAMLSQRHRPISARW